MEKLYHLIYVSKESFKFSQEDITDLLAIVREKNKALNVTGMLLYDEGVFFQLLEGDKEIIEKLEDTISKDERHKGFVKIIFEGIPQRSFADWSMGYSPISRTEIATIDGMNDFFKGGACLADIDQGRAKKLLKAFSQGRWRLS
jgi:hypothetical protein